MTTTPIETLDDLLDRVCSKFCGACGEVLDPPGSQCGGCGALPRETRQEAAERLMSEPDAVDAAEAWRIRKEAMGMIATSFRLLRDADAEEHRSVLRKARDAAEERLGAARAPLEAAETAREIAVQAEEFAAGPFSDAYQVHQRAVTAADEARRLRKGAEAEVEAGIRLEKAAGVMARYRDEAHAATTARQAAEAAVAAIEADIAERSREADQAQAALERCSPVPLSVATVQALAVPLMQLCAGTDVDKVPLTIVERGLAGLHALSAYNLAIAPYAGALDNAEEQRIRKQIAEEAKGQPQFRRVGDGLLSAAWPNPPKPSAAAPGGVTTPPPDLRPSSPFRNTGEGPMPQLPVDQAARIMTGG